MSLKTIAVLGASGAQGGGVADALLAKSGFRIRAITRSKDNKKLQNYVSTFGDRFEICEASLDDAQSLEKAFQNCDGVFVVTVIHKDETKHGKLAIDAAINAKVPFIAFTSVGRAVDSEVPHFATKYEIEKYLVSKKNDFSKGYFIIRPYFFHENIINFFPVKDGSFSMPMRGDVKLEIISAQDIGKVVANAFENPKDPKFHNNAIEFATELLTPNEMAAIIGKVSNTEITYSAMPFYMHWILRAFVGNDLLIMFKMFESRPAILANVEEAQTLYQTGNSKTQKYVSFETFAEKHYKNKTDEIKKQSKILKYGLLALFGVAVIGLGIKNMPKQQKNKK